MDGILLWLKQLEIGFLFDTISIVAAALISITVHETCHGFAALWMGDDTAKRQGRLSLNPLRHVDIMGLIMMALVHFGWAKPVTINMRRFRQPKAGMVVTAIAGPLSNVVLAFFAMLFRAIFMAVVPFDQMGTAFHLVRSFLENIAVISSGLAVFNLFPIPPLDGSKVLFAVLPDRYYIKLMRFERYGMLILIVLLLLNVLDTPLMFLRGTLLNGIAAITEPIFYYIANWLV